MKILDILIDSAGFLGLTKELETLEQINEENAEQVISDNENIAGLFNLVKFSIRELCTNYIPMVKSFTVKISDKQFALSELENFIRVQNVFFKNELVKFKIINRKMILEEDGEYVITYETYPTINDIFEDIDFLQNFSPDVIVFGLCAYYALAHGMFNEFEEFHERYISKAESLKSLRNFEIPCRRWQ